MKPDEVFYSKMMRSEVASRWSNRDHSPEQAHVHEIESRHYREDTSRPHSRVKDLSLLMQDAIPAPILQFIRQHVRSVVQLELLLLLHKEPERSWKVEQAAEQLYIPGTFAESLLEDLRTAGLVALIEGDVRSYRFELKTPQLRPIVDELASLYRERPVATIHAIYSAQTQNLQNFADAFRFRKKENE